MVSACRQAILNQTDRSVYRVIEQRQHVALGRSSDANIGAEDGSLPADAVARMYRFNPRPADPGVPESFIAAPIDSSESGTAATAPSSGDQEGGEAEPPAGAAADTPLPDDLAADQALTPDIFDETLRDEVQVFGLRDALAYATRHARDLQTAKEDLYRAALDLTLERHLWTPQFVATVSADFDDFEREAEFDQAMTAVADFAVTQRLPFGGEITARVIDTLVRELNQHTTTGESGQLILEADIPLLRGAGRTAYESRYAAERALIYAVRNYERFRRTFLVDVAADYFNLQQLKTAIDNTYTSYLSRKEAWEKAEFIDRMGRSRTVFDAPRAKSILRQAEAALVSAKERYATALDLFKIRIGMPVDELLDVLDQGSDADSRTLDGLLPPIDENEATEVALRYRLDLLNRADFVDDAVRGVAIAENQVLPDLDLRGSVTTGSDPEHRRTTTFGSERMAWNAGLELRVDDRKSERNAYRASLITLRQAERDYEEFRDRVRADVRRALRRVAQQQSLLRIQALNVEENERRLAAAEAQFDLGRSTNQDVVDAENDLLAARNDYARAVADYRVAILEFRRDTGTLRIRDDGMWEAHPPVAQAPSKDESIQRP